MVYTIRVDCMQINHECYVEYIFASCVYFVIFFSNTCNRDTKEEVRDNTRRLPWSFKYHLKITEIHGCVG